MKKPSKIDLDTNEPVFILGKKFQSNASLKNFNQTTPSNISKWGNSSFYYLNDSNDNNNNNNNNSTNTLKQYNQEITILTDQTDDPIYSINSDLSMSYSYLSTSPPPPSQLSTSPSRTNKFLNKNMKTPLEQEIYSRLWFTYRKDFEPLNGNSKYTSDCGWGCMLRSAQMLIGQALLLHNFGSDWSLYKSLKSEQDICLYKEIICLFNDRLSANCPFGLHKLLDLADRKQTDLNSPSTRVGTWFGPTSVCTLMRDSLNESRHHHLLDNIRIYVAQDCTIFKQDIIDLCSIQNGSKFIPCIILVSARLGGDSINEIYVDTLKMYLEMENCIGIIGGKIY